MSTLAVALLASSSSAQGIFGKNKVQYSPLEWLQASGEHVTLYFYSEEREVASRALAVAESTCVVLSDTLRHELSEKIPLALFSSHRDFQQSNVIPYLLPEEVGGLTEFAKGRVLVPYTGSFHRFRWVVAHELTHAFMLDKIETALRKKKKPLGFYPPLWFSEGLAEYMSARITPGLEMPLRDAVYSDQIVGIGEMWKLGGGILVYREGHSLISYISERFGFSSIVEILEGWGEHKTFEALMEEKLGLSSRELSRDWMLSLKERYYPEVAERDWESSYSEPIICGQGVNLSPVWMKTEDGEDVVVYLSTNGQRSEVRVRQLKKGGRDRLVLRGGASKQYESLHLFRSRLSGNADGTMVFSARSGERDVVHVYDIIRGKRVTTVEIPGLVSLSSPSLSPDGSSLVLSGQDPSGRSDLFLVSLRDSSVTRLTYDFYDDRDPDWSPDGGQIVFSSDRCPGGHQGVYKLFLMPVASPQKTAPAYGDTSRTSSDTSPRWSPSGEHIAFVSDRGGVPDVHVLEVRTGRVAPVTHSMSGVVTPAWADGEASLLFVGLKSGRYQIYMMELSYETLEWSDFPQGTPQAPAWAVRPDSISAQAYRRKFGLDIVRSTVAYDPEFAMLGSGQLALSDVLGDEHLLFYLSSQSQQGGTLLGSLSAGATYLNLSGRMSYGVGVFSLGVLYDEELGVVRQERRSGMLLLGSYPLSRFDRIDATIVGRVAHNHLYRNGTQARIFLLSNFLSYVWDNSAFHSEGELVGRRANMTLGFTRDVTKGKADYFSVLLDLRENAELTRKMILASRLIVRASFGDEARRFYMGGPWSLRGYGTRSLFGRRVVLVNNEVRLPLLARITLSLPGGTLPLPTIRGAILADAAAAGEEVLGSWKGAVGLGLYIGGGYFPIVRLNAVWRTDFSNIERKLAYEFYIGWNY